MASCAVISFCRVEGENSETKEDGTLIKGNGGVEEKEDHLKLLVEEAGVVKVPKLFDDAAYDTYKNGDEDKHSDEDVGKKVEDDSDEMNSDAGREKTMKSTSQSMAADLPFVCFHRIFSFLSAEEAACLSLISSVFRQLVYEPGALSGCRGLRIIPGCLPFLTMRSNGEEHDDDGRESSEEVNILWRQLCSHAPHLHTVVITKEAAKLYTYRQFAKLIACHADTLEVLKITSPNDHISSPLFSHYTHPETLAVSTLALRRRPTSQAIIHSAFRTNGSISSSDSQAQVDKMVETTSRRKLTSDYTEVVGEDAEDKAWNRKRIKSSTCDSVKSSTCDSGSCRSSRTSSSFWNQSTVGSSRSSINTNYSSGSLSGRSDGDVRSGDNSKSSSINSGSLTSGDNTMHCSNFSRISSPRNGSSCSHRSSTSCHRSSTSSENNTSSAINASTPNGKCSTSTSVGGNEKDMFSGKWKNEKGKDDEPFDSGLIAKKFGDSGRRKEDIFGLSPSPFTIRSRVFPKLKSLSLCGIQVMDWIHILSKCKFPNCQSLQVVSQGAWFYENGLLEQKEGEHEDEFLGILKTMPSLRKFAVESILHGGRRVWRVLFKTSGQSLEEICLVDRVLISLGDVVRELLTRPVSSFSAEVQEGQEVENAQAAHLPALLRQITLTFGSWNTVPPVLVGYLRDLMRAFPTCEFFVDYFVANCCPQPENLPLYKRVFPVIAPHLLEIKLYYDSYERDIPVQGSEEAEIVEGQGGIGEIQRRGEANRRQQCVTTSGDRGGEEGDNQNENDGNGRTREERDATRGLGVWVNKTERGGELISFPYVRRFAIDYCHFIPEIHRSQSIFSFGGGSEGEDVVFPSFRVDGYPQNYDTECLHLFIQRTLLPFLKRMPAFLLCPQRLPNFSLSSSRWQRMDSDLLTQICRDEVARQKFQGIELNLSLLQNLHSGAVTFVETLTDAYLLNSTNRPCLTILRLSNHRLARDQVIQCFNLQFFLHRLLSSYPSIVTVEVEVPQFLCDMEEEPQTLQLPEEGCAVEDLLTPWGFTRQRVKTAFSIFEHIIIYERVNV